ncbi:AMP-binding protein [Nannocystis punicea]|uniref:AMP-binding protein n=1 Tax=Nannocystis punicea TaxID=2995304 RepID=A0ABY7H297_9BACT|nr:AMP-binding protein [Nannocystis poenicansa]WAS93375.1 AMP-binding protein [Nannocystis poenicansa]
MALRGCALPGLVIVGDDGATRTRSYGELVVAIEGFAARLVARGVRGERVAIAAPDPEYMVVATLGALRAGAVPVVLPEPSGLADEAWRAAVTEVMRASEAQRVIRPSAERGRLPSLGELRELMVDDLGEHPLGSVFLAGPSKFKYEDPAFVVCTADRSGTWQVRRYTHEALAAAADAVLAETRSAAAGDKVLVCAELDRCLLAAVLAPLRRRLPFVISRSVARGVDRWLRLIDELGVTVTIAEPSALAQVRGRAELARVQMLGLAGEAVGSPVAAADAVARQERGVELELANEASSTASEAAAQGGSSEHGAEDMSSSMVGLAAAGSMSSEDGAEDMSSSTIEVAAAGSISSEDGAEDMSSSTVGLAAVGSMSSSTVGLAAVDSRSSAIIDLAMAAGSMSSEHGERDVPRGAFWAVADGGVGTLRGDRESDVAASEDAIVVQGCSYDPQPIEREAARVPGICAGQVIALARPGKQSDELVLVAEGRPVDRVVLNTMTATLRRRIEATLGLRVAALVQVPVGALPRTRGGELQRAAARALYARQPNA